VGQASPTVLASGPIVRRGDQHRATPDSMPTAVRVVWATAATITTPARYHEVASAAMQLLAEASTCSPDSSKQTVVTGSLAWSRP
jgi:hypothetical protein